MNGNILINKQYFEEETWKTSMLFLVGLKKALSQTFHVPFCWESHFQGHETSFPL